VHPRTFDAGFFWSYFWKAKFCFLTMRPDTYVKSCRCEIFKHGNATELLYSCDRLAVLVSLAVVHTRISFRHRSPSSSLWTRSLGITRGVRCCPRRRLMEPSAYPLRTPYTRCRVRRSRGLEDQMIVLLSLSGLLPGPDSVPEYERG
jgi:hypothetical protein